MKARFAIALGLGSLAAVAARAEVEFAGYMRTRQGEVFVLTDSAVQKTSEWIAVGGNFAGYRVTGFDVKSEMLAVEKDGATRQLRLKNAAVAAAGTVGSASPPTKEEIAAAEITLKRNMMVEFMAKEVDTLMRRAAELRQKHPEGSPELAEVAQMEELAAKSLQQHVGSMIELDRARRVVLLGRIHNPGTGDASQLAALQAELRELDMRLAKAGVGEGKKN